MDLAMGILPLYIGLLLAGILLVGIEIYVPGGITGAIGAIALVAAMVVGFQFPPPYGIWSAMVIIAGCAAGLFWWARIFPNTRAGRKFSLQRDGSDFRSDRPEWQSLVGKTGRTLTALRPSGIALIEGQRVDVTSASAWVDVGADIRVTAVHGLRVIVEPVSQAKSA